jgi:adenylyltransferase/sulfurtransferase
LDSKTPKKQAFMDRFGRQTRVAEFGIAGQETLAKACAAIVGIGALGSRVAEDLARAGIGKLVLVDRDWVEWSNLHRQHLFDEEDAKEQRPKVVAASQKLAQIHSGTMLQAELVDLRPENIEERLEGIDLLIDGTDNFQSRYMLNDFAKKQGLPWIYGACVGTQSMAAFFSPKGPCLRCIFPEPPPIEQTQTCETAGILPPAAAFTTTLQVAWALRYLGSRKLPEPVLHMGELFETMFRSMAFPKESSSSCPCCSQGRYPGLDSSLMTQANPLCGRKAVQLQAPPGVVLDLRALSKKLPSEHVLQLLPFLLRTRFDEVEITVFTDGRSIVQGTDDPGRARALFDRYLGS